MGSNGKRKGRGGKGGSKDANGKRRDAAVVAPAPAAVKAATAEKIEEPVAEASEAKETAREASTPPPKGEARGAAWAEPIARFETRWTKLETKLLVFVLFSQIAVLVLWV